VKSVVRVVVSVGLVASVVGGCGEGDGGGGGGAEETGELGDVPGGSPAAMTMQVADEDSRPECAEANNSQLIYVLSEKRFQVCNGGSWSRIEIAGKDGADGKDGEAGAAGKDGANGADGADGVDGEDGAPGADGAKIVRIVSCGPSADIGVADFRYGSNLLVTTYSDASVSLSCKSAEWSVGETGLDSSSHTTVYPGDSVGVVSGVISCVPFYVTAEFHIDTDSVKYINQADATYNDTVACTEVYSAQ
jgi:hypothetical protein